MYNIPWSHQPNPIWTDLDSQDLVYNCSLCFKTFHVAFLLLFFSTTSYLLFHAILPLLVRKLSPLLPMPSGRTFLNLSISFKNLSENRSLVAWMYLLMSFSFSFLLRRRGKDLSENSQLKSQEPIISASEVNSIVS